MEIRPAYCETRDKSGADFRANLTFIFYSTNWRIFKSEKYETTAAYCRHSTIKCQHRVADPSYYKRGIKCPNGIGWSLPLRETREQ